MSEGGERRAEGGERRAERKGRREEVEPSSHVDNASRCSSASPARQLCPAPLVVDAKITEEMQSSTRFTHTRAHPGGHAGILLEVLNKLSKFSHSALENGPDGRWESRSCTLSFL